MRTGNGARIVLLTPVCPAARGNGLAMRVGLFLDGLARSHRVSVVVIPVFGAAPPVDGLVSELAVSCTTLGLSEPSRASDLPTVLLSTPEGRRRARDLHPLPALCPSLSGQARIELQRLTDAASLVHVSRSYLAPCLDYLFDAPVRPPVTIDLDDLDSGVQRQLGCGQEGERFERLERYYTARADHVYTASVQDADIVRRDYGVSWVTAIANAVREPALPLTTSAEAPYDLLFVGNLSYPPNVDAARWLCEEIRPHLGPVTIAVVGSRPGAEILGLAELPGVTVAGDVPEVSSWYARSRVAVAPLRIGGGTRVKIVEALAHGRPVIATPLGARGLAVGERNGVLTAATTEEFAGACLQLLRDAPLADRVGAAGRRHVVMAERVIGEIDRCTRAVLDGSSEARVRDP
jgi:polysaccharide biosynthesis protein PslH